MPHPRLRYIALLVALVVSASCTSASSGGSGGGAKIAPLERLRAGPMPGLREEVDLRIEVLINADGVPDLTTLKVTGRGSGSGRAAIEDWVRNSMFKPAMQDSHPVPGVIKMGLKTRSEVRRM